VSKTALCEKKCAFFQKTCVFFLYVLHTKKKMNRGLLSEQDGAAGAV